MHFPRQRISCNSINPSLSLYKKRAHLGGGKISHDSPEIRSDHLREFDTLADDVPAVEVGDGQRPDELREQREERREDVRAREVEHEVVHPGHLAVVGVGPRPREDGDEHEAIAEEGEDDDAAQHGELGQVEVRGWGRGGRRVIGGLEIRDV